MAENVRWITAAEVADNYAPIGSGGGIGGSIADKQVAFGDGTDIAGSDSLVWDDTAKILTLTSNDSSRIALIFDETDIVGPPASTGEIRLPRSWTVQQRNNAETDDIEVLYGGSNGKVGLGDQSQANVELLDGAITLTAKNGQGVTITPDPGANLVINEPMFLVPTTAPEAPVEGMLYADAADHHLYYYNGTAWKQLDNTL